MENLLLAFVETLDQAMKHGLQQAGAKSGLGELTLSQLQYIDAIDQLAEPTVTELAAALGLSKAATTTATQKLQRRGVLTKRQSQEDKRVYFLQLTESGAAFVRAKNETLRGYGEFIRTALTADEAAQFSRTIAKLVALFADYPQPVEK